MYLLGIGVKFNKRSNVHIIKDVVRVYVTIGMDYVIFVKQLISCRYKVCPRARVRFPTLEGLTPVLPMSITTRLRWIVTMRFTSRRFVCILTPTSSFRFLTRVEFLSAGRGGNLLQCRSIS